MKFIIDKKLQYYRLYKEADQKPKIITMIVHPCLTVGLLEYYSKKNIALKYNFIIKSTNIFSYKQ